MSRVRTPLLGAAAALLVLAVLEVGVRLASTFGENVLAAEPAPEQPGWFVWSRTLGWERRPGFSGEVGYDVRAFDARGYLRVDSAQVDGSAPKILLIGDSNTWGFGVPTANSFAEVIEDLLPGAASINLGVLAYSSWQGRLTLEQSLAAIRPAAVVASFNFNDRLGVLAGEQDGYAHFAALDDARRHTLPRLTGLLEHVYLYRGLRVLLRRVGALPRPRAGRFVPVDSLRPRVDENSYRENLEDMVRQTRAAGVPLVFLLLGDNPVETAPLDRGLAELERGENGLAIESFETVLHGWGNFSDLARILLARSYRLQGDEADAAYISHTELRVEVGGGRPIRFDTTYNRIMREVAAANGVTLADGAAVLDEDPLVYIDSCHFNSVGHRKIARVLADGLGPLLGIDAGT